jgi:uncharacterized protein YbaR (Trm112 family)
MDIRLDLIRLSKLNISNFKLGEQILYCPDCNWQIYESLAMNPICPECKARLHLINLTNELTYIIKLNKLNEIYEQALRDILSNRSRDLAEGIARDALEAGDCYV